MENRIKMLREERKMNQIQLGDVVGMSQQSVSRIEQDYNRMTVDTLIRLSTYFDVTVDYLLGLSDKRREIEAPKGKAKEIERYREFYRVYKELAERDRELLFQFGKLMKEMKKGGNANRNPGKT